jgi:hypothetical protein
MLIIGWFCVLFVTKVRGVCHAWGICPPVRVCQIGSND